jgi:hypothetical protein
MEYRIFFYSVLFRRTKLFCAEWVRGKLLVRGEGDTALEAIEQLAARLRTLTLH